MISPTPQWIYQTGPDVCISEQVLVVIGPDTDPAALEELEKVLWGSTKQVAVKTDPQDCHNGLTIHLGTVNRPDISQRLRTVPVPSQDEGYALRVASSEIMLGGVDAPGQFYAVKTLSQLIVDGRIPGVFVSDYPSMSLRGTVEGFYGPPWTHTERLDHLDFLGDTKANTYIYAPKKDPYHRDQWREPYPDDKLVELKQLVERAKANHVRFTFALSPGVSICYSSSADVQAVQNKFQAMYDIGIRSFSIPLDDIEYKEWNCEGDRITFGEPGPGSAAAAQVTLLNTIQQEFIATHEDVEPLQMVPTEYDDLKDTAYKQILREKLNPEVEVMWTGTDVIAAEITIDQAEQAANLFGRNVFVWDNFPVNDYWETIGRVLLAPYDRRESGLSDHVSGLVSNPMNEAAASKLAMFTMNDFSWNDRGYDRAVSGRQAALYVAGGNERAADAVQVFIDLNHAAPLWSGDRWQPQAPMFGVQVEKFWWAWERDWSQAAREFRPVLRRIEQAPDVIRRSVKDRLLLADLGKWLDVTELWGQALADGLDVLVAIMTGEEVEAVHKRKSMDELVDRIAAITTDPAENPWPGPVMVGDPYTYDFILEVHNMQDGIAS